MIERRTGRLAKWRGSFGFIQYDNREVFVHLSNFYPGFIPEINSHVTFELGPPSRPGKPPEAYRVRIVKTADQVLAEFNEGLRALDQEPKSGGVA